MAGSNLSLMRRDTDPVAPFEPSLRAAATASSATGAAVLPPPPKGPRLTTSRAT